MRKVVFGALAFGALAFVASAVRAQSKPDFSGHWTLDVDKSDPPGVGRGGPGGGPGGAGPGGGPGNRERMGGPGGFRGAGGGRGMSLTIVQTGTELTIEREVPGGTLTTRLALGGNESTSEGPRGGKTVSRSHWDGDALVTEGEQTVETPNGTRNITFKEVRKLADGGKTMIVEVTRETPRGEQTRRSVYNKKSD